MLGPSLETISHTPLTWFAPFSVLVASLVGSIHCVSMCGPLVLAIAADRRQQFAYQTGRLISYTSLGMAAGSLGQGMIGTLRVPWLSEFSLIFIAVTLILMGVRTYSGRGMHLRLPAPLERLNRAFWKRVPLAKLPPWGAAGVTGLLTLFLPCGHLYGFAAGAMATGTWWAGGFFMFVFWLGTVPALGFGAGLLRTFFNQSLGRASKWAGALLVVAGLFGVLTFATRLHHLSTPFTPIVPHSGHSTDPDTIRCH